MKIHEIRATGLYGATPKGGGMFEVHSEDCIHTLIAVVTDEGMIGLGSVFAGENLVRSSLAFLEPMYLGENALEPERVSEKLRQHMYWYGRGGSILQTISGIDIALWDILGKATGQPIGRLLGGRYRDRVKPYASILIQEPQLLADHLLEIKDQGFRAFKIGWGNFGRQKKELDESIVRTARETLGLDVLLMVDAGGSDAWWHLGYKWALRTAYMLADYDVAWFEEPIRPDAINDYVLLRQMSPVPIAGGEVLERRQTFQHYISAGAFDIVQPDVTKVGGISEARRIALMANDNGIRYIPHGWNTAVGLAADLQLASALSDTDLVEYLIGSPYIDDIATGGWELDEDGMLPIPNSPGLGLSVDIDALSKYTHGKNFL